jgi:hypothetical protein
VGSWRSPAPLRPPAKYTLRSATNGEARAYSLWQLDAHEIVNDVIRGSAIEATW